MGIERRKNKRLPLEVAIQLEKISDEKEGIVTKRYLNVSVTDLSKGGMAFRTTYKLEEGTFYDTDLVIWTKEVIKTVIKIVRVVEDETAYTYGCEFIGMPESDSVKINIYELFAENEVGGQ